MTASSDVLARLPRLHAITNDAVLDRSSFARKVELVLQAGGSRIALHLRGSAIAGGRFWNLAEYCGRIAASTGSVLIINDRVDIALGVGAAGIQLGRTSFPVGVARRLVGKGLMIGASVHSAEEAREAASEGADFLLAGNLFRTASHPDRPGKGPRWLRELTPSGAPLIGIGGILPDRVPEVMESGAHGIAAIAGIWNSVEPADAVRAYLGNLE